jgi:hypothetical protein
MKATYQGIYVMSDKSHVKGSKMSVIDINDPMFAGRSAKKMAADLLGKHFNGPGDNIETAAYRVQEKYGVDANIIMQGWNRPARGMLTHRWLPLFQAWVEAGFAKADAAYEEERTRHGVDNSALVRLADLVAGKKAER